MCFFHYFGALVLPKAYAKGMQQATVTLLRLFATPWVLKNTAKTNFEAKFSKILNLVHWKVYKLVLVTI